MIYSFFISLIKMNPYSLDQLFSCIVMVFSFKNDLDLSEGLKFSRTDNLSYFYGHILTGFGFLITSTKIVASFSILRQLLLKQSFIIIAIGW